MFTSYKDEEVSTMEGNLYLLQYGTYLNSLVMEENVKRLDDYITYYHDDKYYVFVGASTLYENALLLSEQLENEGIYTYIKNDYLSDNELLKIINTLDKDIVHDNRLLKEKNKEIINLLKKYFS